MSFYFKHKEDKFKATCLSGDTGLFYIMRADVKENKITIYKQEEKTVKADDIVLVKQYSSCEELEKDFQYLLHHVEEVEKVNGWE